MPLILLLKQINKFNGLVDFLFGGCHYELHEQRGWLNLSSIDFMQLSMFVCFDFRDINLRGS